MSANPRNKIGQEAASNSGANLSDPSSWKFMTLGSLALKDGRNLVREHDVGFTINARNAEMIRDLAQFVLDNKSADEKISINASPFYEDAASENVKKYFSHRMYISAETVAKTGKSFADYVAKKD